MSDVILEGGHRYGGFLPGTGRTELIRQIEAADSWDDGTAALAVLAAADVLERPVTVAGPDQASSASYGQAYRGAPVALLLLPGGHGRYLPAELSRGGKLPASLWPGGMPGSPVPGV